MKRVHFKANDPRTGEFITWTSIAETESEAIRLGTEWGNAEYGSCQYYLVDDPILTGIHQVKRFKYNKQTGHYDLVAINGFVLATPIEKY